jgi:hypothetical protein
VTRDEPRISSVRPDLGAGSSCLRRFARPRYRIDRATSVPLRARSSVTIDVHGSLDRAKDVSSSNGERAFSRLPCRVRAPSVRRRRSPPRTPRGHPLSPVRPHAGEETPAHERRTGRDPRYSDIPRRLPASRGSGCLSPSRHGLVRGSLHSVSRAGLSLTPPTRCPQLGDKCFFGHCKRHDQDRCPGSDFERAMRLFDLASKRMLVPGTDDPSTLAGSVCVAFRES